ncbi:hypothetical protein ACET3Z_025983 [Daucus carota]
MLSFREHAEKDMAFVYLSDLKGDEEDWVTRVRVCRMWESISTKDGSLLSVDMILADEKDSGEPYACCSAEAFGASIQAPID